MSDLTPTPQPAAWPPPAPPSAPPEFIPRPEAGSGPQHPSAPTAVQVLRSSGRLRAVVAGILLVAIPTVAIMIYGGAGYAVALVRLRAADQAMKTAISHRSGFETAFASINADFGPDAKPAADSAAGRARIERFLGDWQAQTDTVSADDARLASASLKLNDTQWLTHLSQRAIDSEAARLGHARKAMAAAAIVATDGAQDGLFFRAFADTVDSLNALGTNISAGDMTASKTTMSLLKSNVEHALSLSTGPGFPPLVQQLMLAFRTFASDLSDELDAVAAGDHKLAAAENVKVQADSDVLSGFDTKTIGPAMVAFYQSYVDTYHLEMHLAGA
jgi:hypothetical protein